MFIVDGGYLSWVYGTNAQTMNGWSTGARMRYTRRQGALIVLDSSTSERKKFDPSYKSRREEKKHEDPERLKKAEHVKYLVTDVIKEDPSLTTLEHPGLEADDIVALFVAHNLSGIKPPIRVIGADKDLLQLPKEWIKLERITGEVATFNKYARRLPKTISPYIKSEGEVLLSLTLMGDKSDSIPRLIPPRDLGTFIRIVTSKSPFTAARECFGDRFLKNLYLAILPGPWCYDPIPTPERVFDLVSVGNWARLPINIPLLSKITRAVLEVREAEYTTPVNEGDDW